ncbi:MAG: hydrogenase maturation protease [Candidatus Kryptoniota bacterium]
MITIVGIGNRFRGDDAVGLLMVKSLSGKVGPEIKTVELEGDQTCLLKLMQTTDAMIIVDAVQSSAPAGTMFRIDASSEPLPQDFHAFTTHSIDSVQAIELARAMNRLPKKVIVYGITGKDYSYSEKLSPQMEESIEIVRRNILGEIDHIQKNEQTQS